MSKITLLVLAAGMGSRFGGLKQIAPLGPNGEKIIDYSLYDAKMAGFDRVVFVVKPELLETFKEVIGVQAEGVIEVDYALQDTSMLPEGCTPPEGRTKPWGTGHAVLCARDKIDGPFGVINADDFYGRGTFAQLAGFLKNRVDEGHMCMVGFPLEKTLTENGFVSRGICETEGDVLCSITERTKIYKNGENIVYTGEGGEVAIPEGSVASMNVWGLDPSVFSAMEETFCAFFASLDDEGRQKGEFYLPSFVDGLIKSGRVEVTVLETLERWYGVTYKEDAEHVAAALKKMHEAGTYPNLK